MEAELERWKALQVALDDFHGYLAPHIPRFQIEELNDIRWSDAHFESLASGRPFNKPGVYIIFNHVEEIEYIGVAGYTFNKRIWTHDEHCDRCYTDVIVIEEPYTFLAPALEWFLIRHLKPPKNKSGKHYYAPKIVHPVSDQSK